MKIVILGAGQVGSSLAEHLAIEANDITIVDYNRQQLEHLGEESDIRTIVGHAAHPDVLRQAGIEDADMLLAVTSSDETNMLACQIAYSLFQTPIKMARVRAAQYLELQEIFYNEAIPVDILISPEKLVTHFVKRLIEYPGSLQVLDFAGGRLLLVAAKAKQGADMIGHTLSELPQLLPNLETRIAAIFRKDQSIPINGQTRIELDDEVFFLAESQHVRQIISKLCPSAPGYKRVMIVGGGNVGLRLAQSLEKKYSVKLIEKNPERCAEIAEVLNKTLVLNGDASDRLLLLNENIEQTDVFVTITNDDDVNVMSALMAKKLGARKVMALIVKPAYIELVEGGDIDIAISPQQATVSALLSHVRRGNIVRVHTLRHGAAEAIEMIAHGSPDDSNIVGRSIEQLKLPKGSRIGAIVRGDKIMFAHHDTLIQPEDHVILFLSDRKYISRIEQLFKVKIRTLE